MIRTNNDSYESCSLQFVEKRALGWRSGFQPCDKAVRSNGVLPQRSQARVSQQTAKPTI